MRIILSSMLLTATLLAGASTPTTANKLRPPKRYPITSRGAIGDGRTLNTKAIQAVIDRCAGSSGGGVVENITFRNFRLVNVRRAFEMNMAWTSSRGTLGPAAKVLPVFRRIRLINVSGTAQTGGVIRGLKDSPIENVVFEDCRVTAETGLVVENARAMDYSGLKLEVREGAPVVLKGGE